MLDTSIKSGSDGKGDLVEQGLYVAAFIGHTEAEIELVSRGYGEFLVHVTLFDKGNPPSYFDAVLNIYFPESSERAILPVMIIGTCKCSLAGATGCDKNKCEDGDTCPGNNGHTCGFYTIMY